MPNRISRLLRAPLLASLCLLGACAFTPHEVALAPVVNVDDTSVGQGTKLFVRFVDERDDTVIGHRAVANNGADITAAQLPSVLDDSLRKLLIQKNYQLVDDQKDADASVVYRLRALKLGLQQGFWAGSEEISGALAVDGSRHGATYNQVYRYNVSNSIQVVPAGDQLDGQINTAVNDLLRQASQDGTLDVFLTGH